MDLTFIIFVENGGWRWRLIGSGGVAIARSGQVYVSRDECLQAIDVVKFSWRLPVRVLCEAENES